VKDKIMALEDSAMEEWRKGNPLRWVEISADDIVYIDPGLSAPIVGKEAYAQYLEPLKGMVAYDASEYVHPRVDAYGNTTVQTYNYHSLHRDENGLPQRTSFWNRTEVYRLILDEWKVIHPDGTVKSRTPWNCTEVYAKTTAGWKIVHSHWSYINGRRDDGGI
jgi:ketosteroid isomerase-like protein